MISMSNRIKVILRLGLDRLSLLIFNSSLGWKTLFLWYCYHLYCRCVYKSRDEVPFARHSFHQSGIFILPALCQPSYQSALNAVNDYLDPLLSDNGTGSVALARGHHPLLESFIYESLTNWRQEIEGIFGSHFSCHWISVYRIYPFANPDSSSSFGWHYDEDPPALKKVFIYLDDTTRSNGAFRCFSKSASRLLFRRGFISNSQSLRARSQALIDSSVISRSRFIEGKKGMAFIFDNNIIHRGTHPESGYRTVISIEVMPSSLPFNTGNIQKSIALPIINDYPAVPWKNPYLA